MQTKKKPTPSREQVLARLSTLKGAAGRVVRHWLALAAEVVAPRSNLHPTESEQAAREQDRWGIMPGSTPRWAADFARAERDAAEERCQVVWPNFPEPEPLPPVDKGERLGWSFHGSSNGAHRVFPTLRTPSQWGEVTVKPDGRKVRPMLMSNGSVVQYASRQGALRAAHYKLCREVASAMYLSLLRAHQD